MSYLIGADEAGYGPNLGPLVISATVWKVDGRPDEVDLYQTLAELIAAEPSRNKSDERLAIADSKLLYKPRGTLRLLERGLLPILAHLGHSANDWAGLWNALEADPLQSRHKLPWYQDFQLDLPIALLPDECDQLAERLAHGFDSTNVHPLAICSRAVFPAEFNALVEEHGTKGAVLSRITIGLVAKLINQFCTSSTCKTEETTPNAPVFIVCDKHGGRNRYGEFLQRAFPETLIEVGTEGRPRSMYRWGPESSRTEIQFRVGGESFLPTALASMASKYLREIAMRAFNQYWLQQVPGLKPTAGYPVDARRFYDEIAQQQRKLDVPNQTLWRDR